MKYKHNPELVHHARQLRRNMTREEKHLWYDFLRDFPVRFVRQKVIGHYIADFYCAKARLVVEVDGGQHFTEEGFSGDAQRTQAMQAYGLQVVRIPNNEVWKNFAGVCEYIAQQVKIRMGPD